MNGTLPTRLSKSVRDGHAALLAPLKGRPPERDLPRRAEGALSKMSKPLAEEMCAALTGGTKRKGYMSPKHRDDDTQEMDALAVLDAFRALDDYNYTATSIAEMITPIALDIITRRVEDVIWEEINLCRVFLTLRRLYRYIHLKEIPGHFRHRISYYLGAPRRDQSEYLRTTAEYITGAVAVAGLAEVMATAGDGCRARSMLRDASLLAVGAEVAFRTQELHRTDITSIEWSTDDGGDIALLFMAKEFCKNRKGRIGTVRNAEALNLLRRVIGSRIDGPLFTTNNGTRLGKAAIYKALRRTSLLALGVPLTANLLRRAGVSEEESEDDMGRRIGDTSGGSRTSSAAKFYGRSLALEGLALLRKG